ncbi:hypothetical protein CRYUN_Cryun15aG0141100 [Craigia yunnanensis]
MAMGEQVDSDQQLMVEGGFPFPHSMQIDPRREREDGVILDFAGPNFVCVNNFTFGAVTRYIQINKGKEYTFMFQLFFGSINSISS